MSEQGFVRRHRSKIVSVAITLVALVLLLVFWRELFAWFTGEPVGGPEVSYDVTARAGAFEVGAALRPDPPRQEGNRLHLRITEGGEPVEGAEVGVTYLMPAMGAMPEMRGEADVEEEGDGIYVASFDLPMGGSWSLEVEARKDGRGGDAVFGMTVGTEGLTTTAAPGEAPDEPPMPALPEHAFDAQPLGHLRAAFSAYEQARALLAADRTRGLAEVAGTIAEALRSAHETAAGAPPEVRGAIGSGIASAELLAQQTEIEGARRVFSDLSLCLVGLAGADPRLAEGYHVFRCPMVEHFPKWFQLSPSLENPYMGTRMLQCGVRTEWTVEQPQRTQPGTDEIAYYTCPMHPSVRAEDEDETCPICAMDLTPVTREEVETGVIFVDEARRQAIGVRTAEVERRELSRQIRAVGTVVYDQARLHDVNLRMSGWVQQLRVAEPGARVRRGQVLFTLYSPELYAAQLEYLTAATAPPLPEMPMGPEASARESSGAPPNALERAARQRLILLGMSEAQVRALRRRGEPSEAVPILAPASGWVVEKNVVEGAQVEAGTLVYRIADLDQVWVEVQVYESDLPHVRVGQEVRITVPYLAEREFTGRVGFVYPYVDPQTRTARVRIELANADLALRPDMYANATFDVSLGEQLAVPMSAVIYTGPRRIVFVDLGEGRLRPKVVELGARAGDYYVVRSGLDEGDVVVTSGNFLIAAESRLRSAAEYWGGLDEDGDGAQSSAAPAGEGSSAHATRGAHAAH